MKQTKKLLAALLTLALALSLALPALAEDDPPALTHITAEWNGVWQFDSHGRLDFNQKNVTVTLHYDDDSSALYAPPPNVSSSVLYCNRSLQTDVVTVTYLRKYTAEFSYPANWLELLVEEHKPLPALELDKRMTVPGGGVAVYAFTPGKSGEYRFQTGSIYVMVLDSSFASLEEDEVGGMDGGRYTRAKLREGETYYIAASLPPSFSSQGFTAERPGEFKLIGESVLKMVIAPFGMINGLFVLILPLYMLLMPVVLPVSALLTVVLAPFTALAGLIMYFVNK